VHRCTSKEGERTLNSSPLREPPFSPLRGVEKKKKKFLNKKNWSMKIYKVRIGFNE
jgi:hypothetical protein